MAAGANGPMKYVGLTEVQSDCQKLHPKSAPERLTSSDADIRVRLPDFIDSLLSQSLGGGINVKRIITRESLFPRRGVPIYQVAALAADADPSEKCNSSYHLQ